MKKLYFLAVILCISITSGCGTVSKPTIQISPPTQKVESTLTQYNSSLVSFQYPKEYTVQENNDMVIVSNTSGKIIIGGFKPSVGYPEADENDIIFQKISYNKDPKSELDAIPAALYYRSGDTKTENELMEILKTVISTVPKISEATLPPDIHPLQIVKVVNGKYALVAKSSLNVYMPNLPQGFQANYSGVLQWNESTESWEKFLVIEDTNKQISSSNNPVDMWWEGLPGTDQVPHLQVVDSNGAGSGEGIAKVLVPTNIGLDQWKVVDCFYYAYDLGKAEKWPLSKKECQAVKVKLYKDKSIQTYKNEKYGFEFEYPSDVRVENGWVGISFRVKEPLVIVKNKEGDTLFTMGTTDYFGYDDISKTYTLKSPTDVVTLKKNCTTSFLGNPNIHSAEIKSGDGFDSFILYNFLTNKNIGLGIETYRTDMQQPGFNEVKRKEEQQRIDLEQQILKTLHFFGNNQSVNFSCNNSAPTVIDTVGEQKKAQKTLVQFFDLLSKEDYINAIKLFYPIDVGTNSSEVAWQILKVYSPTNQDVSKEKDLEYYCDGTGTCLHAEVLSSRKKSEGDYVFTIQFKEKNGNIMLYGPFGGASEKESPPQKQFEFEVKKIDGQFKVITAPLYRP